MSLTRIKSTSGFPLKSCNNSVCAGKFVELEETIERLKLQLKKEIEEKLFYAELLTKTIRNKNA